MGASLVFEASAFDPEDRGLRPEALNWTSSLDGDLGTGEEIRTRSLSAGRHTITVTATDSDGLSASTSFQVEVDDSVIQALPKPETEAAVAGIFERLALGLDPAPAASPLPGAPSPAGPSSPDPGLVVGLLVLLLGGVAGGSWLVRQRSLKGSKIREN
jgi:hypothetical protein